MMNTSSLSETLFIYISQGMVYLLWFAILLYFYEFCGKICM